MMMIIKKSIGSVFFNCPIEMRSYIMEENTRLIVQFTNLFDMMPTNEPLTQLPLDGSRKNSGRRYFK